MDMSPRRAAATQRAVVQVEDLGSISSVYEHNLRIISAYGNSLMRDVLRELSSMTCAWQHAAAWCIGCVSVVRPIANTGSEKRPSTVGASRYILHSRRGAELEIRGAAWVEK